MNFKRAIAAGLFMFSLAALGACGPVGKTVKSHTYSVDTSELELDRSQEPTLLYKRPGAPTLAEYSRFIIDPVRMDYSDPEMQEIGQKDIQRMQVYFQDALAKELQDAGYEVATRSAPGTMRISMTISGFQASKAGGAANVAAMAAGVVVGFPMVFAVSVGEVTVEGVFRESVSNRVDAVAVATTRGSRLLKNKPWSTWADVEGSFDIWAEGIREAIDKAHGR